MTNYDKQKFAVEVETIATNLVETLKRKNADYGNNVDKNIDEWGLASLAIRLDDKLNRFKNLIKEDNTRQVDDESLADTLLDLAGYAILGYRKLQEMQGYTQLNAEVMGESESVAVFDSFSTKELQEQAVQHLDVDRRPIIKEGKTNKPSYPVTPKTKPSFIYNG